MIPLISIVYIVGLMVIVPAIALALAVLLASRWRRGPMRLVALAAVLAATTATLLLTLPLDSGQSIWHRDGLRGLLLTWPPVVATALPLVPLALARRYGDGVATRTAVGAAFILALVTLGAYTLLWIVTLLGMLYVPAAAVEGVAFSLYRARRSQSSAYRSSAY